MRQDKPVAYRVQAVPPLPPGSLATAAIIRCAVSGEILSGSGGGGEFISPEVREWLHTNHAKNAYAEYAHALIESPPPRESA